MKNRKAGGISRLVMLMLTGLYLAGSNAMADKEQVRKWRVPIVMERATVRGKIVILETRAEERRTVQGLRVEIWTWKQNLNQKAVPDQLIHQTKTDRDGFFSLPVIDTGNYLLVVGDLQLKLTVVEPVGVKTEQQEPKILLILLPKEVI